MAEMISREAYLAAAEATKDKLQTTLRQLEHQQTDSRREVSSLVSRTETALSELAAAILADVSPESVDAAVALTGCRTLAMVNPATELTKAQTKLKEQLAERSQQISARTADISELPIFQNRLLLRAPRTGTLVREITELEEFREPLAQVLQKAAHPRLQRLLDVEYGLPSYSVPFWRLSYFADWKAGDEIVAGIGGNKTFAEIRSEYLSARDGVGVYDQKLSKLRAEVAQGEAVEREYDLLQTEKLAMSESRHPLQAQLARMPEQFLKDARIQLERYLADLDLVMIGDRLQTVPQLDVMAKRYFGLRKQTEYLRQTSSQLLDNTRPAIEQSLARLQRDIAKYQRPKYAGNRFDRDQFQKLGDRNKRCLDLMGRHRQAQQVIVSFHGYEHGRLDEDFLWWDLVTDGQLKANYIDEVARFRALHPAYKYRRPKKRPAGEELDEDGVEFLDDDGDAAVAVIQTSDSFFTNHRTDFS